MQYACVQDSTQPVRWERITRVLETFSWCKGRELGNWLIG